MDIRKNAGFFTLFFESFALVNRSAGALFAFSLLVVSFVVAEVLGGKYVPQLFLALIHGVLGLFLMVLLFQILSSRAEKTGESISQLSSRAVFPTIYLLLFYILVAILGTASAFLANLSPTPLILAALYFALFFLAFVPLFFAPISIALREQGPIQAIHYSWAMVKHHYIKTLATIIVAGLLPSLFLFGAFYAIYAGIPLYFANQFDLANLSPVWYAVGAVLALGYVMIIYVSVAFPVLVFLNMDYVHNRGSLEVPEASQLADATQDIYNSASVLPASMGMPVQQVRHQQQPRPQAQAAVGIKKASVASNSEEFEQQHLDQVYSPENAKVQEYMQQEEDRMPTILFDDDMSKQIEETRKQWGSKKEKENTPEEDSGGIKISHR